jgi:hypothetical protein
MDAKARGESGSCDDRSSSFRPPTEARKRGLARKIARKIAPVSASLRAILAMAPALLFS